MGQGYTKKPTEELVAEAQSGNIDAQNALGMLHELGLIPQASATEAARLYAKSAKAGDPVAALYLGVMYDKGAKGLAVDKQASASYFNLAEKSGFRKAEDRLAAAGVVSQKTVLVVADSATMRGMTRALLSKSGYAVVEASDAAQALRFLQAGGRVDLVLSDVEMPNMDGVEMLSRIRTQLKLKDLPVVMMTSVREVVMLKKAKTLGVQGWILKPYDHDILVQTLKKAFAG